MSYYTIESLKFSRIHNLSIRSGYIFYDYNNWGGCYENGNVVYDFHKLSNSGTIIGSPTLANKDVIYNYPTCLIPGFFVTIGGKWEIDQEYYSLDRILESSSITKILGIGTGDIQTFRVSEVSTSGVGSTTFITDIPKDSFGNLVDNTTDTIIRFPGFSDLLKGYVFPKSTLGPGEYMELFEWDSQFGIDKINGTNSFPFYGWGGTRLGDTIPRNFQYLQDSTYSYPSFYLNFSKVYNPEGIIYPGQLLQYNNPNQQISVLPYQEGRGVFDYMSRDVIYNNIDGQIILVSVSNNIPAEGAVSGRNTSFAGIAVTNKWSDNLNINNIIGGSRTPKDNGYGANNAPLCYIPTSSETNSDNPIPWNLNYKQTCDTLQQGITSGIITGAYPLYRGGWSSRWSGSSIGQGLASPILNNGIVMYNQYYTTDEFWNPNNRDESTPQVENQSFPVKPNPPYCIKGGRIMLFEGQRIKAGTYVYSTIGMISNVTAPQFIPPGAKEIILNRGEASNILPDIYSKTQGNQGGLIVMVTNDDSPPPNPPSNCVPVGIVMEDVIGYGTPESFDNNIQNNIEYKFVLEQRNNNTRDNNTMAKINPEQVKQIQAREILVRIFPMGPLLSSSAFSSSSILATQEYVIQNSLTVSYGDFNKLNTSSPELLFSAFQPIFQRCRNDYYLPVGSGGYTYISTGNPNIQFGVPNPEVLPIGWGWRQRQARNDYPQI